jgi:UDP-GlcNAc:undecaprenyl-phosphate GlcNAc-1-phosphate transferase
LAPGKEDFLCSRALLKLELPLMGKTGQVMGSLWLVKSLADDQQIDFTLRRVEHLRRTVVSTLEKLQDAP